MLQLLLQELHGHSPVSSLTSASYTSISVLSFAHGCVHSCVCIHMCVWSHVYTRAEMSSLIILCLILWRQSLSLSLELTDSASLASQSDLWILLSLHLLCWDYWYALHCCTWGLGPDAGPHSRVASISQTEPTPRLTFLFVSYCLFATWRDAICLLTI